MTIETGDIIEYKPEEGEGIKVGTVVETYPDSVIVTFPHNPQKREKTIRRNIISILR